MLTMESDAEHPTDITMDASTTRGPTTRAQARAIETKVNSLLAELLFNMHDMWVLPHGATLCILRYTGDAPGEAQDGGQGPREEEVAWSPWISRAHGVQRPVRTAFTELSDQPVRTGSRGPCARPPFRGH